MEGELGTLEDVESLPEVEADLGPEGAPFLPDEDYANAVHLVIAKARTSFLAYYHLFNPQGVGRPIILGDLHRFLISLVQDVFDGTGHRNNAVSVPPQHGKSTLLAVEAATWLLGVSPTIAIALTSFSHSLVTKFSKAIRERLQSELYQLIFPGVLPKDGSNKMDEWETDTGGSVVAKSSGSKLTGRRVDWLILDDVHPGRAEAESPILRKKVIDWYTADCLTRLHPDARQFLIGTRFHPKDLIGHLRSEDYMSRLREEGHEDRIFNYVSLPAIAIEGEPDALGRQPGEALFPEERPLSFLSATRSQLPGYEWDSQYQQRPRAVSSAHVDVSQLVYISPEDVPWDSIDEIVRGWDTALSERQLADFTAGALSGIDKDSGILYIMGMVRVRKAWAVMRSTLLQTAAKDVSGYPTHEPTHFVSRTGIEGVAGFRAVVEDVRQELLGSMKVELRNPPSKSEGGGSKLIRAQGWLNKVENGQVVIVRGPWVKDFVDELEQFPGGAHDDQIDVVSITYEMLTKPTSRRLLFA